MNKKKESKVVPNVRFKGFTDDWKQRKLGDEAEEILAGGDIDKEKAVDDGMYPIYANALTNDGIVGYYDDFYRVKAPAVTVTGRGEVGRARARMIDFTPVVRLLAVRSNHDCYFLENAINNHKVVVESTGVPQLSSYDICFPKDIVEEKKIGTYFNQLDRLITFHQQKITLLTKLKKAMLEKMFPKKGSVIPEIRFNGFANAWEQRKVLDLLIQPITDGPHETPKLVEEGVPFISVDAIVDNEIDFNRKRGNISEEYDELCCKKYKPQFHDVYLVKSGSTVGKVAIVETTDRFNIWSPLAAMRCGEKTYPYFLYDLLQTKDLQAQVADKASNGTQPNLSMRELEKFPVSVPSNLEEQKKIGDYFRNLDHLITLYQRKIDKIKNMKKAMLDQMFI